MRGGTKFLLLGSAFAVAASLLVGLLFGVAVGSLRSRSDAAAAELASADADLARMRSELARLRIEGADAKAAAKKLADESAAASTQLRKLPKAVAGPKVLANPAGRIARATELLKNVTGKVVGSPRPTGPAGERALRGAIAALDQAASEGVALREPNEIVADGAQSLGMGADAARLRTRSLAGAAPAPSGATPGPAGNPPGAPTPAQFESLVKLVRSLADAGKFDEALQRSDEALSVAAGLAPHLTTSSRATALSQRSWLLERAGRDAEALAPMLEAHQLWLGTGKYLSDAAALEPRIGAKLLKQGKLAEAEAFTRAALSRSAPGGTDGGSMESRALLAIALRRQAKVDEALRVEVELNAYAEFMRGVYGGWSSPEWVDLLVERGDINAAEDALWYEALRGFELKAPDQSRSALERTVQLLAAHPTPARDARRTAYRRWLERTAPKP